MKTLRKFSPRWIWAVLLIAFLAIDGLIAYQIPSIRDRVNWRAQVLHAEISSSLFPMPANIPTPNPQYAAQIQTTLTAMRARCADGSCAPTATSCPGGACSTETDPCVSGGCITPTPTFTATPLPAKVALSFPKSRHEFQKGNNCGPATLSLYLRFWGWTGNQYDIAKITKPMDDDVNVMPKELEDYVAENTSYYAMVRTGGTLELAKRLIAAGIPVMIEKGIFIYGEGKGWMGHYTFLTGYDDAKQLFTTQDSLLGPDTTYSYAVIQENWRPFNYHYILVYPPEKEPAVREALGADMDPDSNLQSTIRQTWSEIQTLTGEPLAFAWYNLGTNYVALKAYNDAAAAYDQASSLGTPWRMIWYQTGPYWAYYYANPPRYQDIITLATFTLDRKDVLEESWYWRGLARWALGDTQGAIDDWRMALYHHPGFAPALYQLGQAGANP